MSRRDTSNGWRVLTDNQRQLPCHAATRVRIKYVQPGVQMRWCDRCEMWRFFDLVPLPGFDKVLKIRWMTDAEVADYHKDDCE